MSGVVIVLDRYGRLFWRLSDLDIGNIRKWRVFSLWSRIGGKVSGTTRSLNDMVEVTWEGRNAFKISFRMMKIKS